MMPQQTAPAPVSFMPQQRWLFPARCTHVVDGDTVDVVLDQGRHTYAKERLRLLNVNTPERKGGTFSEGDRSRQYTVEWLAQALTGPTWKQDEDDWPLIIETHKSDAFGRYLALVWRVSDGACLNDDLIRDGMARVDIR